MTSEVLLTPIITKNISDKLYERRKIAALEVETLVKTLVAADKLPELYALIDLLSQYAKSSQVNTKKGGLLCLAACAVGLAGSRHPDVVQSPEFVERVTPAIISSLTDPDSRVRYYGIESLYNVAKSTRLGFLHVFLQVFDALFRLCSDSDSSVQNAATFLDNLVKDAVCGSENFDFESFLSELERYLIVEDSRKRAFLLGWISLLDSLPAAEPALLSFLPTLLPPLLVMLSQETSPEVRQAVSKLLNELKSASSKANTVNLAAVLATQLHYNRDAILLTSNGNNTTDENSTPPSRPAASVVIMLEWLEKLVKTNINGIYSQLPTILAAELPYIASSDTSICQAACSLNSGLLSNIEKILESNKAQPSSSSAINTLNISALLEAAAVGLEGDQEVTKLETLRWMRLLVSRNSGITSSSKDTSNGNYSVDSLMPLLCDALSVKSSDKVIQEAASVLAAVAKQDDENFATVITSIVACFKGPVGIKLLQRRGSVIIKCLCEELGGEAVLRALAKVLQGDEDGGFVSVVVQAINLTLVTAQELQGARELLCGQTGLKKEATDLFTALFNPFSQSAGAALSLCLLSRCYTLAWKLVEALASPQLSTRSANVVELSQLVSILEAPSFASLRLQLLSAHEHPMLLKCLYGVLMLLPQGDAFRALHTRLSCLPTTNAFNGSDTTTSSENCATKGEDAVFSKELVELFFDRQLHLAQASASK